MSHAKVLLADNYATVGSMNLSHRSAVADAELNLGVDNDPTTLGSVEQLFANDVATSKPVDPNSLHTRLDRALAILRNKFHLQY
jgi:phosphatidylserine/phosphatidylglycerophosphate/cardiolipin synthase-like enzyme